MKRMKPDEYKKEAAFWVEQLEKYHLPRSGEWNLSKIMGEIERILRTKRRQTGRKSVEPSPKVTIS